MVGLIAHDIWLHTVVCLFCIRAPNIKIWLVASGRMVPVIIEAAATLYQLHSISYTLPATLSQLHYHSYTISVICTSAAAVAAVSLSLAFLDGMMIFIYSIASRPFVFSYQKVTAVPNFYSGVTKTNIYF